MNNSYASDLATHNTTQLKASDAEMYNSLKIDIRDSLVNQDTCFFIIAKSLWEIKVNELYFFENYPSIMEFASDIYDLKKSSVYNYLSIVDNYAVIDTKRRFQQVECLREEYIAFSYSKLLAMLPIAKDKRTEITPDWTVRQIKEYAKELNFKEKFKKEKVKEQVQEKSEKKNIVNREVKLAEFEDVEALFNARKKIEAVYLDMLEDDDYENVRLKLSLIFN